MLSVTCSEMERVSGESKAERTRKRDENKPRDFVNTKDFVDTKAHRVGEGVG